MFPLTNLFKKWARQMHFQSKIIECFPWTNDDRRFFSTEIFIYRMQYRHEESLFQRIRIHVIAAKIIRSSWIFVLLLLNVWGIRRYFWLWSMCKFIAKFLNWMLWKLWLSTKNSSFVEMKIILVLAEAAKTRGNFYAKLISIRLLLPEKPRFQNCVFN